MRLFALIITMLLAGHALAYTQVQNDISELPQEHAYQQELRRFLATLTAEDYALQTVPITVAEITDSESLYRLWLLRMQIPSPRGTTVPAEAFTLAAIEGEVGLRLPFAVNECQSLAWLAGWDYPGNPYFGSRAVKLRALTLAAVDMVMLDYLYDHDPRGADRSDYLGGNLIWIGYTYWKCRDALPAEAQAAFSAGLRRLVEERLVKWGPKGLMTDMDLFAPVGLWYAAQAIADPEFTAVCRAYSEPLFTDPKYFHPAGYFVDNGCFDTSYNGISLHFGVWAALASDWAFADEALAQASMLRARLTFPAPRGSPTGPSGMSSRTSASPARDQWMSSQRDVAQGWLARSDRSAASPPSVEIMTKAHTEAIADLNRGLAKPWTPEPVPWKESHWSRIVPYAYEHCPPGQYARLVAAATKNPAHFQPVYNRAGTWTEQFADAFTITRQSTWAAAIHTGPVGIPVGHNGLWYGSGGGQLSVFWTNASGVVVTSHRRGVQGKVIDSYAEWRSWPVHAVIGETTTGGLMTSGRIREPQPEFYVSDDRRTIEVGGIMPVYAADFSSTEPSKWRYDRRFILTADSVTVETHVAPTAGAPELRSLYESIPVLITSDASQPPTRVLYRVGAAWIPAPDRVVETVSAIRLLRFDGGADIVFERPRSVTLSPLWTDGYQTQSTFRTLLIDLMPPDHETPIGVIWTISPTTYVPPPKGE